MRYVARTVLLCAWLVAFAIAAAPGFAFDEPNGYSHSQDCQSCHNCGFADYAKGVGPHGGYTAITARCEICHDTHAAASPLLLPKATIKATCETCHDGTAGFGVYGVIAARGLGAPAAQHRIDTSRTIPGGDAATGGSADATFTGIGDNLTCDDCHSPHGSNVVNAFRGERQRTEATWWTMGLSSNRLLKRRPTSSVTTATDYGSDWCLTCHQGRASGGAVHNHPVDSAVSTTGVPFNYANVALVSGYDPTGSTVLGPMVSGSGSPFVKLDDGNRGFLMPFPRTSQQEGHAPICQQCHEDARFVGTLSADGLTADVATFSVTLPDGNNATDTPRFQNFPHETTNRRFLVETDDDLCMNCHPPTVLP